MIQIEIQMSDRFAQEIINGLYIGDKRSAMYPDVSKFTGCDQCVTRSTLFSNAGRGCEKKTIRCLVGWRKRTDDHAEHILSGCSLAGCLAAAPTSADPLRRR